MTYDKNDKHEDRDDHLLGGEHCKNCNWRGTLWRMGAFILLIVSRQRNTTVLERTKKFPQSSESGQMLMTVPKCPARSPSVKSRLSDSHSSSSQQLLGQQSGMSVAGPVTSFKLLTNQLTPWSVVNVVAVVVVYFILSRLASSANLDLLCMLHPGMGPIV